MHPSPGVALQQHVVEKPHLLDAPLIGTCISLPAGHYVSHHLSNQRAYTPLTPQHSPAEQCHFLIALLALHCFNSIETTEQLYYGGPS